MRKIAFFLIACAAVVACFAASVRQADALSGTVGVKNINLTILITPSPIVYVPTNVTGRVAEAALASGRRFDQLLAYDQLNTSDMVAQTNPQSSVKVQFTVKPDPTYAYFHLTPVSTNLNAGYGANTFTCVYKIFGYYPSAWNISDFAYGSSGSGGTAGFNGFPMYNYPTASVMSWLAETVTGSFAVFANDGAPGQTTFTGTAGQTRNICVDISLNVSSAIPAGTYSATITYRMTHT